MKNILEATQSQRSKKRKQAKRRKRKQKKEMDTAMTANKAPPQPPPLPESKKGVSSLISFSTSGSCKRELELEGVKGEGGSIPVKSLKTELEEKQMTRESKGEARTIEDEWNGWLEDYQQLSSDGVMTQQLHGKLKRLMLQFIQEPMHHKYLVQAYEKVPIARKARLTGSGQTSLHLLAQNGSKPEIVEQVLTYIDDADILKMKDDDGNTALHIAAEGDKLKMCCAILSRSTDLIKEPNKNGKTPSSILTSRMFQFAKDEKWDSVVTAYKQICEAVGDASRIPHQTPIHVAVKMGNAERAEQMLEDGYEEALKIKDENGDTALHLAVAKGMRDLCRIIVGKSSQLVNVRNGKGQTPLFLSALNGNTSIYSYLRQFAYRNVIIATTDNGNTALHCAISYEHFDTAYHILHSYPCHDYEGLLFNPNKDGETPLTILANKPDVFKSGTPLPLIERIIYSCIHFSTLEKVSSDERKHSKESSWLKTIGNFFLAEKCRLGDVESPHSASGRPEGRNEVPQSKFPGHLPVHYAKLKVAFKITISFLICHLLPANVVEKMKKLKRQHLLVHGIMEKLVENEMWKGYVGPLNVETRLLIAARMGVTEMVKEIVMRYPQTLEDKRLYDNRNVVHMAIESRQADVFELLVDLGKKGTVKWEDAMTTDKNGNNALHLAAVRTFRRPWGLRETLQLHWEIKWYNYVRDSVPEDFSRARNKEKKTPLEVFREEHKHLLQSNFEGEWLNMTSQACSLVAGLIATVAFSSATTIPGGNRDHNGFPNFQGHPALTTFTISSFVALCFSLISLIMFLTILISPSEGHNDVGKSLPEELVVGLTTLLLSIGAMMVSFCAGHYFYLKGTIKYVAIPLYLMGCLSISYFFFTKFYSSFLLHFSKRKPEPCYSEHSH